MIANRVNRKASIALALSIWLFALLLGASKTSAQTTQFTYQGKLTENGAPINALYDFILTLWDAPTNGNQIGQAPMYQAAGCAVILNPR